MKHWHNITRDRWALRLHDAGWSFAGIALLFGISRPRVHQLVERARYARITHTPAPERGAGMATKEGR